MPFFWRELDGRGTARSPATPRSKSVVTLTNTHRFSYPGYSEILTGEAHDDVIKSNDRVQNPYPTVLEELKSKLALPTAGVGSVRRRGTSFNEIVEHTPGVDHGQRRATNRLRPRTRPESELSRMQFETPTPWNSRAARCLHLRPRDGLLPTHRPRVVYLALGETDDWAHDGRYDRVLDALRAHRRWLPAGAVDLAANRSRTIAAGPSLLITTDHGRGRTPADWNATTARRSKARRTSWMAFISPAFKQRGEWRDHAAAPHQSGGGDDGGLDGRRLDGGAGGGGQGDSVAGAGTSSPVSQFPVVGSRGAGNWLTGN